MIGVIKMLELVNKEAVGKNKNEAKLLIDEKTIKALKESGIIKGLGYIYLAIEIEKAENADPKKLEINLVDFADRWNLRIIEIQKANLYDWLQTFQVPISLKKIILAELNF